MHRETQIEATKSQLAFVRHGSRTRATWLQRSLAATLVASLLFVGAPRSARADTPLVSLVIGVAASLTAAAIYDYVTSETTTETESSTTDDSGAVSSDTSTRRTSGPSNHPKLPYFQTTGTPVARAGGDTVGPLIGMAQDNADVLLTSPNIHTVSFNVARTVKTVLARKSNFPAAGSKVPLELNLGELTLSTRDIPKTLGWSTITLTVSVNGQSLYTFTARVDQGKLPVFSDPTAAPFAVERQKDLLSIEGFKKRLEFVAAAGRSSDELVVKIVTQGTGKRLKS